MKVLQVIPGLASSSGGPGRATLANCRAARAVAPELEFTLVTTGLGLDDHWRQSVGERMPAGSRVRTFRAFGSGAFTFSPGLVAWLHRRVAEQDVVEVQALLHPISSVAAWVARRAGVPYVVVPHGTLSEYTFRHRRRWLKVPYFRLVESRTLTRAAAVRFTTDSERKEASRLGPTGPAVVIPHPFEPSPSRRNRRSETGDGQADSRERFQVLFLSRLDRVKGLDVLLPAMAKLRWELPEARLLLAGSGTEAYARKVRREIETLGLGDTVATPGFLEGDEKERALASSDVFVLPSRHENFGVAVVEAMDAGLPVVVTPGVGIWREIQRAGAGVVVERSPEAVASALIGLLGDAERRRRMGTAGRVLVRERFSPLRIGRRVAALYRRAAERPPAADPEVV